MPRKRHKIKDPAGVETSTGCEPEAKLVEVRRLNKEADIYPCWTIPPIYEDCAKIRVQGRLIIIEQSRLMERPCQIELSLREAEQLMSLLPAAIAAAKARLN